MSSRTLQHDTVNSGTRYLSNSLRTRESSVVCLDLILVEVKQTLSECHIGIFYDTRTRLELKKWVFKSEKTRWSTLTLPIYVATNSTRPSGTRVCAERTIRTIVTVRLPLQVLLTKEKEQ